MHSERTTATLVTYTIGETYQAVANLQESLSSTTKNVQEFFLRQCAGGRDTIVARMIMSRNRFASSPVSVVAEAAVGDVPGAPPQPAALWGSSASSSCAWRGPCRSAPSCTRRCRTAYPLFSQRTHARSVRSKSIGLYMSGVVVCVGILRTCT
jgi:hypothetical protein